MKIIELPCKPNKFQCQFSKKCIPQAWICDMEPDCTSSVFGINDTSDEDVSQC